MRNIISSAVVVAALISGPACAKSIGKWNSSEVDGFAKYWTTNNVGSNLVIWCHPDRKVYGTLIQVVIEGNSAPPDSHLRIAIDRDLFKLPVDSRGYVNTICPSCSDSFDYVWNRIRGGSNVAIKFQDERYAGFSLKGAREILPGDACPTDWDKQSAGGNSK